MPYGTSLNGARIVPGARRTGNSGRVSASGTGNERQCATNGQVMSTYTVTAREREPGEGERGSPAVGWKLCAYAQVCGLPRRCATYVARLAMTGKNNASLWIGGYASASGTCIDGQSATNGQCAPHGQQWPRQCARHLRKGAMCRTGLYGMRQGAAGGCNGAACLEVCGRQMAAARGGVFANG